MAAPIFMQPIPRSSFISNPGIVLVVLHQRTLTDGHSSAIRVATTPMTPTANGFIVVRRVEIIFLALVLCSNTLRAPDALQIIVEVY